MPDSPHAVSVALPRWQDVVDYEEKNPKCLESLKAIYPRFGFNPLVAELTKFALHKDASSFTNAWPFPTEKVANLAKLYCDRKNSFGKTKIQEVLGLPCLFTDQASTTAARAFWQHTGLGASSRQTAIALGKERPPSSENSIIARDKLRIRLSNIYECDKNLVQLHPSGMAAFYSALEAIQEINPGKKTIQLGFPYVDVLKLPKEIFEGSELILSFDPKDLVKTIEEQNPAALVVELPSNPMLQCVDLPLIAEIAHSRGIPVIADDTIGSALNINAFPHADLVFSSLTKSFAGRGDILAGALVLGPHSRWRKDLIKKISSPSAVLSDPDSIALELVSRDVGSRLKRLNRASEELSSRLAMHPSVSRVLHPGSCSNFRKLMRDGAGYGCLLSFELKGGLAQAKKVYNSLKLCKGPSLGTNFTLVCPYVMLAHYNELDWAQKCGVPSHLLRVSVGLEDPDLLWEKFQIAFQN